MQFVAEDPVHVVVSNDIPAIFDTKGGMVTPSRRRVFAKFTRGTAPQWARKTALELFEFRKMPERGVSVDKWIAFYDSVEDAARNGWTDEERELIEQKLQTHHSCVEVEAPKIPAPYPHYDRQRKRHGQRKIEHVIAEIVETVKTTGIDPEAVIAYESENENDAQVIAAVAELLEPVKEHEDEPLITA